MSNKIETMKAIYNEATTKCLAAMDLPNISDTQLERLSLAYASARAARTPGDTTSFRGVVANWIRFLCWSDSVLSCIGQAKEWSANASKVVVCADFE